MGNKFKLGILVNSLNFGGNERSAINIAKHLPENIEVSIIVQENIDSIPFDGRVISLNLSCREGYAAKAVNSIRRLHRLKKIVRKEKFDCLFIILPVSNIINYAKYGCKKIVSCREYGDLVVHSKFYRQMAASSDCIVFNSLQQQLYFRKKYPALKSKCKTVYNILDIDNIVSMTKEQPEQKFLDFTKDKKTIISVGRFAEQKAFCHLLKSFKLISMKDENARLVMLGDGELRDKIENLIHQLKLDDKVLLMGFQKELYKYVANSDVFVLPSYSEGFPNVLIEALACGTPVVAVNCPSGPAEILSPDNPHKIKHGFRISEYGIRSMEFTRDENAWNYRSFDEAHKSFANAVLTLLQNENLRNELGRKGKQRAESFRAEPIIREWEKIFR